MKDLKDLTIEELYVLKLIKDDALDKTIEGLRKKEWLYKPTNMIGYILPDEVIKMLENWEANLPPESQIPMPEDTDEVKKDKAFYFALAGKLQEIFPKGKKPETSYLWRCTKAEVAIKLKTLVVKYGYSFTEEQALEAARRYVESFKATGNYKNMRLLKYFILKTRPDAGGNLEVSSEFMSLIENADSIDSGDTSNDWLNELR